MPVQIGCNLYFATHLIKALYIALTAFSGTFRSQNMVLQMMCQRTRSEENKAKQHSGFIPLWRSRSFCCFMKHLWCFTQSLITGKHPFQPFHRFSLYTNFKCSKWSVCIISKNITLYQVITWYLSRVQRDDWDAFKSWSLESRIAPRNVLEVSTFHVAMGL